MTAAPVVEAFDVPEHGGPRLVSGSVGIVMQPLRLERAEERVGDLLKKYETAAINEKTKAELRNITEKAARKFGMQKLPEIE